MSKYKVVEGTLHGLADTSAFIDSLNRLDTLVPPAWLPFFKDNDLFVTRAPGRLDVMGGISDYSGSLVLQLPIASAAHVALQKRQDELLRVISLPESQAGSIRSFEMKLFEFISNSQPIDYDRGKQFFLTDNSTRWVAYVLGAFLVLMREKELVFHEGANILIHSLVPEGKGVSSSAALEVAVMKAIDATYELGLSGQEIALLCQKVENLLAGAPCGIMDQMTSACGDENRLLELICQPCDLRGALPVPDELELWGIDSGVKHSVGGSAYTTVRTATFMGYRIIADLAGLPVEKTEVSNKVRVSDDRWNGFLANLAPREFEEEFAAQLPDTLSGKDFLATYGGITDPVTSVDPSVDYPIGKATRHPIYESDRVKQFAAILKGWSSHSQPQKLGELMFQSHESYSSCGLGASETDLLIKIVKNLVHQGLYGARITGGGSGGTVAVLGQRGNLESVKRLLNIYNAESGRTGSLIAGSSPGASAFGHLKLRNSPFDLN